MLFIIFMMPFRKIEQFEGYLDQYDRIIVRVGLDNRSGVQAAAYIT